MVQTNAEKNIVGKILIILIILLSIICATNKVLAVSSNTTNTTSKKEVVTSSKSENLLDIENKEDVKEKITNYILTINTEGLTQSILSDVIELYTNLTEKYSNDQIADMLDDCKGRLSEYGVKEENLDSITTILRNLNTTQISLEEYSETGIGVAQKILPSIVGIKVEFPVNSIFLSQASSTATAEGSGLLWLSFHRYHKLHIRLYRHQAGQDLRRGYFLRPVQTAADRQISDHALPGHRLPCKRRGDDRRSCLRASEHQGWRDYRGRRFHAQ